jgi:hypothetical protein
MAASMRWCGLVIAAIGCGKPSDTVQDAATDAKTDAPIPQSCLFTPPAAPTGGVIELGAVDPPELNNFTVVKENDPYQTYSGPQGGYHLWIDARISGIDLGDGTTVKSRPQTRFNIYLQDGTRIDLEDCAYRLAYHDGGDGKMYLSVGWLNQILNSVGPTIDHTPLRLKVEVLDRNGLYAIDERWVNALAPVPTPIGP